MLKLATQLYIEFVCLTSLRKSNWIKKDKSEKFKEEKNAFQN